MQIKKKLNNLNKLYIIFFSSLLFINLFFTESLYANAFKIKDLEIYEPFELNFDKEKVINNGFIIAFDELLSTITTSDDKKKLKKTSLAEIKSLIDSFRMSNERFINNEYHVMFDVTFNKKNTLNFFEKKNIFPSIPLKKKLLLIPILVDIQTDEIRLFNNNIFYKKWNEKNKRYFLLNYLLPSEDLEDISFLELNNESIEDYDFKETIEKYDLNDFIITIIYKNKDQLRILSKMQINQSFKIDSQKYKNIDLSKKEDLNLILTNLKTTYENYLKSTNQINTSIKLPITIALESSQYKKIEYLESILNKLDLISFFEVSKFNNENIYYKVIYNGTPNKFVLEMKKNGIDISNQNQIWEVQ